MQNLFENCSIFTEYMYILLRTKFAAVACLVEGQFLPAMEKRVKFLILWHGIPKLILSIKEGQNSDPMKL